MIYRGFKALCLLGIFMMALSMLTSCGAAQETQAKLLPGEEPGYWVVPPDAELDFVSLWLIAPYGLLSLSEAEVDCTELAVILSELRPMTTEEEDRLTELIQPEGESVSIRLNVNVKGKGSFAFLTGSNAMVAAITPAPGIVCRDKFRAYACAPDTYERLRALCDTAEQ